MPRTKLFGFGFLIENLNIFNIQHSQTTAGRLFIHLFINLFLCATFWGGGARRDETRRRAAPAAFGKGLNEQLHSAMREMICFIFSVCCGHPVT